ncbi:MAG: murein L,D-transpeptidase [Deltaproteobacteria bacterium]|nr:murein L,D-transpeptidase [Deltaproteobacteria bacterium]
MVLAVAHLPSRAAAEVPSSARSRTAVTRATPAVEEALQEQGLALGSPVFLRILKEEETLEVWVQKDGGGYELFRSYPICTFSGTLGPKTKQGDLQAPEGFYFVTPGRLNPASSFHLSFNLGYPNAFDRAHARTGDYLMVHGACASIGCYAMTDPVIEDLWVLMDAAYRQGQPFVRVHAFPFAMTEENLASHAASEHAAFWEQLAVGWQAFERTKVPPNVEVRNKRYVVEERTARRPLGRPEASVP